MLAQVQVQGKGQHKYQHKYIPALAGGRCRQGARWGRGYQILAIQIKFPVWDLALGIRKYIMMEYYLVIIYAYVYVDSYVYIYMYIHM